VWGAEVTRPTYQLGDARGVRGGVVMVMGEPGMDKPRTLERIVDALRAIVR
jgi:hypothetical protein